MSNAIDKLLAIAKAEVGYMEKKSNKYLDSFTANAGSNNYTKYWRDIKSSWQTQPWCACWVTWCFVEAFGEAMATSLLRHFPFVYCPTMAQLFTLHANPKVGDIVIFKRKGVFAHTGIVCYVKGDYFETYEGNTSAGSTIIPNGGEVCHKSYYNSNLPGTKFCRPDYELAEEGSAHWGEVYRDELCRRGVITDAAWWSDYEAYTPKSQALALLDKLTGGMWTSEESDANIHWVQPVIISLCGKKVIKDKSQWLNNSDALISKALLLALIDNATGGVDFKYATRDTDHWGRNHLDSLCDKAIVTTPEAWIDFEDAVSRAAVTALMCKAFAV